MSEIQAEAWLAFCRRIGPAGSLFPRSVGAMWKRVEEMHSQLGAGRDLRRTRIPIPASVQRLLSVRNMTHVAFQCEDIVRTLVRLLLNNR